MHVRYLLLLTASYCMVVWIEAAPTKKIRSSLPAADLFQGDMRLTPEQRLAFSPTSQQATYGIVRPIKHWPHRVWMRYDIDPELEKVADAVNGINQAVAIIRKYTCVTFRRQTRNTTQRIYFQKTKGPFQQLCSAPLGYIQWKTKQVIELTPDCYFYTYVLHLIMHSLGFLHEHTRPDRDQYVYVNVQNTLHPDGYRPLFEKVPITMYPEMYNRSQIPYDYMSLLHPPFDYYRLGKMTTHPAVYSNFPNPITPSTVAPKDSRYHYETGQRRGLSYWDQRRICYAYHCWLSQDLVLANVPNLKNDFVPDPACYDLTQLCFEWKVRHGSCGAIPDWTPMKYWRVLCKRTCGLCTYKGKTFGESSAITNYKGGHSSANNTTVVVQN